MAYAAHLQDSGRSQPSARRSARVARRSSEPVSDSADDQMLGKLHSVALRAAMSVLLSVVGLGSAMAQSIDPDMALSANTQATRDRVISEMRQARAEGAIKSWSPVLLEVPFKAPMRGARFEPFSAHRAGDVGSGVARVEYGEHAVIVPAGNPVAN